MVEGADCLPLSRSIGRDGRVLQTIKMSGSESQPRKVELASAHKEMRRLP